MYAAVPCQSMNFVIPLRMKIVQSKMRPASGAHGMVAVVGMLYRESIVPAVDE
jgi:hypothetical protein